MEPSELMRSVEEWRRQRDALKAERQARLADRPSALPLHIFRPDRLPAFTWLWYRGQLMILRPPQAGEIGLHRFGGQQELTWLGRAPDVPLHRLLTLDPRALKLDLPTSANVPPTLPLYHPFRSSRSPELAYQIQLDGRCSLIESPAYHSGDRNWPYPNYPATLPEASLAAEGPWAAQWIELLPAGQDHVLSVQDIPDEGKQCLIVMVTVNDETLGVSLLGPDADDNAVQIVFLINPENWRVWTYNQCS